MTDPDASTPLTRRTWLSLAGLWLALVIVLGNALDPVGPALETRSGSAFNAFTSDVALGPARNQETAKARSGATGRDRHHQLSGGGDVALLPQPLARTVVARLDLPPPGALPGGLPAQGAPLFYQARAPPRA